MSNRTIGIRRNLDELGRITLPKEYRKALGITERDLVEIQAYGNGILITPCKLQCVCCGSKEEDKLVEVNEVLMCPKCVKEAWDKVMNND